MVDPPAGTSRITAFLAAATLAAMAVLGSSGADQASAQGPGAKLDHAMHKLTRRVNGPPGVIR